MEILADSDAVNSSCFQAPEQQQRTLMKMENRSIRDKPYTISDSSTKQMLRNLPEVDAVPESKQSKSLRDITSKQPDGIHPKVENLAEGSLLKIENKAVSEGSPCGPASTHPEVLLLKREYITGSYGRSCSPAPQQPEKILLTIDNNSSSDGSSCTQALRQLEGIFLKTEHGKV